MKCDRCGETVSAFRVSYFNTDTICLSCQDVEEAHPLFAEAKQLEAEMVLHGIYNFPGIGLPPDLQPREECV